MDLNSDLNENESYDVKDDWKFVSIIQFVNLFKNVIAVDSISSLELENSLRYPEIEPQCLNILLKLLMKKALFKPNSKIGENFAIENFNEMLLKKIHFFYKTYIRYVKKINGVTENSKVFDLIRQDVDEYNERKQKEIWNLNSTNLSNKEYDDVEIKNIIISDFFRELGGRNPFLRNSFHEDKMELYLKGDDENEKIEPSNIAVGNTNVDNVNSNANNDYLLFTDLSLRDKVEILFFFCNYAITFSGRAEFYREEIVKESKESNKVCSTNQDQKENSQQISAIVSTVITPPHIKVQKNISPIGKDSNNCIYYYLPYSRDCRIYLEKKDKTIQLIVKNYEDLEKFLFKLENLPKSENNTHLIKNLKDNLLNFKENDDEDSKRILIFQRKQQGFEKAKKLTSCQGAEIERYTNSDFFIMNISDHVITRNQLNQITKTNQYNQQTQKTQTLTEDDKKKIKVEKEKLERQKRLDKRNKIFDRKIESEARTNKLLLDKKVLNKKRNRLTSRKRKNKYDSSEEEYLSSSPNRNDSSIHAKIELISDHEDEEQVVKFQGEYIGQLESQEEIPPAENGDVVIEGNLIYRHSINQIEMDGVWGISTDLFYKERLSYLFQKTNEYLECDLSGEIPNLPLNHNFTVKICAANLFECIIINKQNLFSSVLEFLSGEFVGYFMYYGKTIEDRVFMSLTLEDSLVRVSGNFEFLKYN